MHFGYIYEIKNDLNGKTYVGKHEYSEGNDDYMGSGILLPPAYEKYGIQHFTKRIIQYSPNKADLNRSEELWIDFYKGIGKAEYNEARGGQGGDIYNCLSEEKKAEFRRKCSEANKGPRNPMYGKPGTMLGRHHSEESKQKNAEANKGLHKGKHWKLVDGKRVWY